MESKCIFYLRLYFLYFRIIPDLNEGIVHNCRIDSVHAMNEVKAARQRIRILDTKSFELGIWKREVGSQGLFTA